jgi:hypothetical protein
MAHAFFPERLSNNFQDLSLTLSEIFTKFDAVPSIAKLHRVRHTTANKKT